MLERTAKLEILLALSISLDNKETELKKKLYNIILIELNLFETSLKPQNDDEYLADIIIKKVGEKYFLPENYYTSKMRIRPYVLSRQLGMYFIKKNTILTQTVIGKMYRKDHATVIHSIKTIDNLLETDKRFKIEFENLSKCLGMNY